MLFTVIIIENENGAVYVTGSTSIGYIKGVWKDEEMPENGRKYPIELQFPVVEREAVVPSTSDIGTKILGDKTSFCCECVDFDTVYYLRLSVDGTAMLDVSKEDPPIEKGQCISFSLPFEMVCIYPVRI